MRLIDADVLRRKILECSKNAYRYGIFAEYHNGKEAAYLNAVDLIDGAPIIEERKHGRWITIKAWHIECSECRYVLEPICYVKNYCPNCGAIMDGNKK